MYARVLAKTDQFITEVDIDRFGTFPQSGIAAILKALLVSGRMYKDFGVLQVGLNKIDVASGLLFDAGQTFYSPGEDGKSVQEFIPFEAGKKIYVSLIAQGRSVPGFKESRQMEREIATSGGGATTQLVPETDFRAQVNEVVLSFAEGAVSTSPQRPPVPLNCVAIADILIGSGGIETITRRTESLAPGLDDLARLVTVLSASLGLMQGEIAGLRNDLAAAFRLIEGLGSRTVIAALTSDMARVKDRLDMPDTGSPYGADRFIDSSESDTGNVDYKAQVQEGVRFPYANFNKSPIAFGTGMANSANLMHAAAGIICPKYTPVDGVVIAPRAGSLPLGGTQYTTVEVQHLTMSREVPRYGDFFDICENNHFWSTGRYDPGAGIFSVGGDNYKVLGVVGNVGMAGHQVYRIAKYWYDTISVPYDAYIDIPHTIHGVTKSQSWIQSQGRWTPGVRLAIESWSAGAQITACLVEGKDNGDPDTGRVLAACTLTAADFKAYTEANGQMTRFPWGDRPYWLKQGFFTVVFATIGDVQVAYAEGQQHLGGTLSETTDGKKWIGDLTRDLVMTVEFCRFDVTALPVQLAGLNLDGGVHNISIKAGMIVPTNADARFALMSGGAYRSLPRPRSGGFLDPDEVPQNLFGAGVTPYYDFRVELAGNQWEMPVIDLNASEVNPGNQTLKGILGPSRAVSHRINDPDCESNYLLQRGVNSFVQPVRNRTSRSINGPQGKTFWGFFNTSANPKWRAINMVRTRKAVLEVIPRTLAQYIGRNLGPHLITTIGSAIEGFLGELHGLPEPVILSGWRVLWPRDLNSNGVLSVGGTAFRVKFQEAPPLVDLQIFTEPNEASFDITADEIAAAMSAFNVQGQLYGQA